MSSLSAETVLEVMIILLFQSPKCPGITGLSTTPTMVMSINPNENRNVLRVPFKMPFYVKDTKRKFVKFMLDSKDLCLRRWRCCAINDDFILVRVLRNVKNGKNTISYSLGIKEKWGAVRTFKEQETAL